MFSEAPTLGEWPGGAAAEQAASGRRGEGGASHRTCACSGLPRPPLVVLLSLREKRGAGVAAVGALSQPAGHSWLATAWPPPHRSVAASPARQPLRS